MARVVARTSTNDTVYHFSQVPTRCLRRAKVRLRAQKEQEADGQEDGQHPLSGGHDCRHHGERLSHDAATVQIIIRVAIDQS